MSKFFKAFAQAQRDAEREQATRSQPPSEPASAVAL